jgi:hypothetical protein
VSAVATIDQEVTDQTKECCGSPEPLFRRVSERNDPEVLTDIYRNDTNISIWKRDVSAELIAAVDDFINTNKIKRTMLTITAKNAHEELRKAIGTEKNIAPLVEDMAQLIDMFCCLFELKRAGVRLTSMDQAMCPRFHVDKIPCRLVSTYQGIATDWLPNHLVDRTKLGAGSEGKPDDISGLFHDLSDIQCLNRGDVALLKGEFWEGNEGAGLIHRSPPLPAGEHRLLLTLDFIDL